jgi:hypothetical protein
VLHARFWIAPRRQNVASRLFLVTVLTALGCGATITLWSGTALAQSDGRLEDRLLGDWHAPSVEEYAAWLAATSGKKRPDQGDVKRLESKVKDAKLAVDRASGTTAKAKLARRYAELLAELADAQRAAELAKGPTLPPKEEVVETDENGAPKVTAAAPVVPAIDHKVSTATMRKAIEAYRTLFDKYPKFRSRAELQLEFATLLARTGSPNAVPTFDEAAKATKVGKKKDKNADENAARAALGAGEALAAAGNVAEAKKRFEALRESKSKAVRAHVAWRLAWIAAGDKPAGLPAKQTFAKLKRFHREACDGKLKNGIAYTCGEARRDLIVAFADAGKPAEARSYFDDDSEAWSISAERFGERRLAANRPADAVEALTPVVAKGAERDRAPIAHALLARAQSAAGDGAAACKSLKTMQDTYVDDDGAWHKAHKGESIADVAETSTRATMRSLTDASWNQAHATKDAAARIAGLNAGNCMAALYLKSYPKVADAPFVRLDYAAALAEAGQIIESARQYLIAAGDARTPEQSRHTAAARMLALSKQALATVQRRGIATVGTLAKPAPMVPAKQLWVDAVARYAEVEPEDAAVPELRYDAALLLAEEGHDKESVKAVDGVIAAHAATPAAAKAVRLALALHRARRDWDGLVVAARGFLNRPELAPQRMEDELRLAWRDGLWFKAETLWAAKKTLDAAKAWLAFQREFQLDAVADQALAKASGAYLGEGKGAPGINACEMLISGYPKSPLRAGCEWSVAETREQLLAFEDAARSFERFAIDNAADGRALTAWARAAGLYKDSGNLDMAAVTWERLAKAGAPGEGWLRIAALREKGDEIASAVDAYRKAAAALAASRPEDALFAQAKAAALTADRLDDKQGVAELTAVIARIQAMPAGSAAKAREAAAEAQLKLATRGVEDAGGWRVNWADGVAYVQTRADLDVRLKAAAGALVATTAIGQTRHAATAHLLLGELYERAMNAYKAPPEDPDMIAAEVTKAIQDREAFILDARTRMLAAWKTAERTAPPGLEGDRVRDVARAKLARHEPGRDVEAQEPVMKPSFAAITAP